MNTNKKNNKIWNTPKLIFLFFSFCIFLLYLKFAYLSLSPTIYGKNMSSFAKNRNTVKQIVKAKRGTIYDNTGNILALNVSSYTIVASLEKSKVYAGDNYVKDPTKTAELLAPILNMDIDNLKNILSQDKYQVELGINGKGITELKKDEILALGLTGISFTESQKRYYPNGDFASYVIGYAKTNEVETYDENDNKVIVNEIVGELGVESKYNDILSGVDGYLEYQQNRYGYKISGTKEISTAAKDGNDIYLTIDSSIQRFIETAVKQVESTYSPEWVMITAMDAETGDILGTSTTPSFDPNIRDITNYENPLVSLAFEPGSTMKIYTYMCAMENNVYEGNNTYMSGSYTVGGYTVNDWNIDGWGSISFDKGFEYSSNVGVANIMGKYLTKKQLKACLKEYGFGEQTGIELSREQKGAINFNYDIEVIAAGYGQGITTTAVQQLQALTLIANDGKMVIPHIVSKIIDTNTDKTVYERKVTISEQIVKSSTITKMKDLMYNVIHGTDAGSTGYPYRIDGFDIIGKTGTSQIYDNASGTYLLGDNLYIYSFAGMYPKDDPKIIIYAAMKKPIWGKSSALYNATKDVIESISKYKNMFTEITENKIETYTVESYTSKDLETVKNMLIENELNVTVIGDGSKITKQSVIKGTKLAPGDKIILVTNSMNYKMPNIYGWSRNDAVTLFNILGIKYSIEGYGYVISQSINSGTTISSDTSISIKLENKFIEEILVETETEKTEE